MTNDQAKFKDSGKFDFQELLLILEQEGVEDRGSIQEVTQAEIASMFAKKSKREKNDE